MVRKFKLINANGAEWDLMRKDGFLYQPGGLGVAKENEYMRIGSTYELVQRLSAQKQISFVMIFASYAVYRSFTDFCVFAPLKLAYNPGPEWAYIDGELTNLGKTEISPDSGRLECDGTFTATSLWYIPRAARKTSPDVESPKRYNYTYDYTYADELNGYIRVTNNASEDSPAVISIMGAINNPSWYVSVNNDVIASGSLAMNIAGSGPSVFALANRSEKAQRAGAVMEEHFTALGIPYECYVVKVSNRGARLIAW